MTVDAARERRGVVVTGGASGIGFECATHFAERGDRVVVADLADGSPAVARLPHPERHRAVVVDVADRSSVAALAAVVREEFDGRVDVVVNCAGIALLAPARELSAEQWDRTLSVNLTGSFTVCQALGPLMLDRGSGRIVNLASQASVVALDRHVAYCASKAAVVGMTRVLAAEWAAHGVTVNAVSPTVVDTELGRQAWEGEPGEQMRAAIPVGRFAETREVAALVGYLASDDAAMVTGQNIVIDGGYTAV
ncbi:D-threitol dehydrogenase [Kocuria tytonicola]|uniref:GolD/DthD family dehydrogenase n=1 Tax=Kocuria tytonicola TaxID=2055946 RepID=UPI000EF8E3F8|nr:D-threitol dehydrogenase [Kocuria tytonicola]RLZ02763.1 D-threitol dehydrogenase [Kocuria tytonicola]